MTEHDAAALHLAVLDHPEGATVTVRVVPRAPRTVLAGRYGDSLKLRVHAPPVDGAANDEVRRYLGERCGTRTSAVELVRGAKSRDKVVLIRGRDAAAVRRALTDS